MDTELATINKGPMTTHSRQGRQKPARQGLWRRRTALEKALIGVCGVVLVALMALVSVVATSSSSSSYSSFSAPAEELVPQ